MQHATVVARPARLARPHSPAARARRPSVEERIALSIFTVSNTLDDNSPGSLRRAINDANVTQAADTIVFDAAVFSTPKTINLTSPPAPPQISWPLTIVGPVQAC